MDALARFRGQIRVINSARWGADSQWGLTHVERRVVARRPDAVFLEFAINDADARRNIGIEQSTDNLKAMIERIQRSGATVVFHTTNPVFGPRHAQRPNLVDYYDAHIKAAARLGAITIDVLPDWIARFQSDPHLARRFLPDGLHPTASAADELIVPALLRQLAGPHSSA